MESHELAESAMITTNSIPLRVWHRVKHSFVTWRDRGNSCTELKSLSDSVLRDVGLSHGNERFKRTKPFWLP
jgi:uncharacterized protein YjiS (DUF1127 family)